jgi:small-conductance mechanosensitive channel
MIEWIEQTIGLTPETQIKLFYSMIGLLVLWLLRFVIYRFVWKRTEDIKNRYFWKKTLTYLTVFFSILLITRIWFKGFQGLTTYLGLLSAGLAIALKDLVTNIASWVFIILRRPFTIGDRIQIGATCGDVIDIRLFQFTLMEIRNWIDADQSTGRIIHIPNGKILVEELANYTKGFRYLWNEIPVLIPFESNWEKAKTILDKIVKQHSEHLTTAAQKRIKEVSKKYMILYSTLTPTVYTSVKESGVLITLRYLCEPRKRRGSEQEIWENILREFSKHSDVDFAYPTERRV